VGEPRDVKIAPGSVPTAQFSIQFTVAAALIRGDFFLKELEPESIKDDEILDLASRIYVESDPSLRTDFVLGRTVMEIDLEGQPSLKQEIELPLGNPSRPMKYDACAEKFRKCTLYSVNPLQAACVEELIEKVSRLQDLQDVSVLMSYLY
jgi:2-methylcitrate dehydratase PrpD